MECRKPVEQLTGPSKLKFCTPDGPEPSVLKTLNSTLEPLVFVRNGMKQDESYISCFSFEESTMIEGSASTILIDGPIPVDIFRYSMGFSVKNEFEY